MACKSDQLPATRLVPLITPSVCVAGGWFPPPGTPSVDSSVEQLHEHSINHLHPEEGDYEYDQEQYSDAVQGKPKPELLYLFNLEGMCL